MSTHHGSCRRGRFDRRRKVNSVDHSQAPSAETSVVGNSPKCEMFLLFSRVPTASGLTQLNRGADISCLRARLATENARAYSASLLSVSSSTRRSENRKVATSLRRYARPSNRFESSSRGRVSANSYFWELLQAIGAKTSRAEPWMNIPSPPNGLTRRGPQIKSGVNRPANNRGPAL